MAQFPDINVIELTADWKFEITKNGISGFRRYISENAYPAGEDDRTHDVESLPNVGNSWDENFLNVRLQRIEVKYVQDCPKQVNGQWEYKIYDCYYESTPVLDVQDEINEFGNDYDIVISAGVDQLLTNIDHGGQFIQIEVDSSTADAGKGYKWQSDNVVTKQALNKVINTCNYKLQKDIGSLSGGEGMYPSWQQFLIISKATAGKVNDAPFLYCPTGTLLYHGAQLQAYISESGAKKYKVEMSFEYRQVTGVVDPDPTQVKDGWNFVLREKRANATDSWWDMPYWNNGVEDKFLYDYANFEELLTAGKEQVDFPKLKDVNL